MSNITNLSEFITELKELGEPEKGYTRFFRGHSNVAYKLEPSIYREDHLIKNEDKIIKDAFTFCSDYFEPYETLFEKLVKLQHYGYATRLLDISSNALVALYFSALGNFDKEGNIKPEEKWNDGEVIVFDIPNNEIKYDDSDVISILSAISLRKSDFDISKIIENAEIKAMVESALFMVKEHQNNSIYENPEDNEIINNFFKEANLSPKQALNLLGQRKKAEVFKETFNKDPEIVRLLHDIHIDKPSFAPIINCNDLSKVTCVKTKHNNPRISKQQGAFLIFGINQLKLNQASVPNNWIRNENKLIIDKNSKESILTELQSFGISHQSLFPELDSQAKFIMNKYKE